MIFSNCNFPLRRVTLADGPVHRYQIGSRYSQDGVTKGTMLLVPAPAHFNQNWHRGMNSKYTIARQAERKLHIVPDHENKLCLILSSRLSGTNVGHGNIRVLRDHPMDVASIVHAVDCYDPECCWTELIVWAQPGDAFYLTWHTAEFSQTVVIFVDQNAHIHEVERNHLYDYCQRHQVEPPFRLDVSNGQTRTKLLKEEWRKL